MTSQHIFYIPTVFVLGLVFGTMISRSKEISSNEQLPYKTSGKRLLQTFLIFLLVFVITHVYEIPWGPKAVSRLLGGFEIFDKRPIFSGSEIYERIRLFPEVGLLAYKRFTYTIDILFPASFFVFLFTFARFVSQRVVIPKYLGSAMIRLPFLWFGFDLIENAAIFHILSTFPDKGDFLSSSLGFITAVKFCLLFLSILTPSLLYIFAKKGIGWYKA